MKYIFPFILIFCMVLSVCGCSNAQYRESDFLGKTSAQIVSEFGEFDCVGKAADADGLYRNTSCGYSLGEPDPGLFSSSPELLFYISFDENGIACRCYESNRPEG